MIHNLLDRINGASIPPNVWEQFSKHAADVKAYAEKLQQEAKKRYADASDSLSTFREQCDAVVHAARDLRVAVLEEKVDLKAFMQDLEQRLQEIMKESKSHFPSSDEAPGHDERKKTARQMLIWIREATLELAVKYGANDEAVRSSFEHIMPALEGLIVITGKFFTILITVNKAENSLGDITEQHPDLASMLLPTVVAMAIPESLLLRPLLSFVGFGPEGPVKGEPLLP